jgi:NAD(P)-dependent dehydrogenase (short-subunit alcohol dehydrogenase family)
MAQDESVQIQGSGQTAEAQDPREAGPKPPFPEQEQPIPGSDADMRPLADHGEESYRGHARLQGKAALITGADSGIGRAVALAYAREGADILISYLCEDEDARETVRLVEMAGRRAVAAGGDIGNEEHCKALVQRAFDEFGKLDILINNAAHQKTYEKIDDITSEDFDETFRTNVYAMFYLCRAALPKMQAGGSIINTASIQAYDPSPALLAYAATKGAIVTFSKALAQMAGEQGVRVNVVAPGPVWTPLVISTMPTEQTSKFGENTVFKRPAQPAELAPIFVFLASDEASYVTGEVYGATGGQSPT